MLLAIGHFCIKNVLTFLIWSNGSEKRPIFLLINRVDLVRFVDLGYQIFFLPILGLWYVDTCYPSENGSSAGFPDPKLTPSQPLLWKWHFLPDLGANLENLGSRLRLVTFMAWSCASTWKNMPGGVKPIFTAIGPGKCQKNGPKTTLQKSGRAANENNKCSIFFAQRVRTIQADV